MFRSALIAALAGVLVLPPACSPPAPRKESSMSSLAEANRLVMEVEALRGMPAAPLGADGQIAFGTMMFKYLPDRNQVIAAILVAHDPTWNRISPAFATNYRRARAALSEPAIGGRFDTGGGAWMFEEATGKTYLYAAAPADIGAAALNAQIERMARLVPAWETRWLAEVARIAHGKRPAPTRAVTLDDDPYAGQL
ncbi:MAG TPA: hypothetical protein VF695_15955 [Sphingomonas sp.]|jgi:hypothetical protein